MKPLSPALRHRRLLPALLGLALLLHYCALAAPLAAQEQYQLEQGQWQKQAAPAPGTPEGQLQEIRKLIAEEHGKRAWKRASKWIKEHPNHPLLVEAYLLRGDAKVANKDYYKALYDYEYVIRQYPGTEQFNTALEREFQIAKIFAGGVKRKLWGMRIIPAGGEAEETFIRIQERSPGSELGEQAMLALGAYYYKRAEMRQASDVYDLFLANYPRSIYREQAMLRLIQSSLATFKGPKFDATGLIEAAQRLRQYRGEFPAAAEKLGADALLVRIDESLALKSYYTARWYDKRGKDVSAAYMYGRVVQDHPQTAAARLALVREQELGKELLPQPAPSTQPEPLVEPLPATAPATVPAAAQEPAR